MNNSISKFGGNLPQVAYDTTEEVWAQFEAQASQIPPGGPCRVDSLFHVWAQNGPTGKRLDAHIMRLAQILGKYKLRPIVLLMPCPHPANRAWYPDGWSDWWLPSESVWIQIRLAVVEMVQAYEWAFRMFGITDALYQIHNEPINRKPGGSNQTQWQVWPDQMHRFWHSWVEWVAKEVPGRLVTPAISSFGEQRDSLAKEVQSCFPPEQYDWSKHCDYRAFHLRFNIAWAQDLEDFKQWFIKEESSEGGWIWQIQRTPIGRNGRKGIIFTECYLSPGDCGFINGREVTMDDMAPYLNFVVDRLSKWPLEMVTFWGWPDYQEDAPNNRYIRYGGFAKAIQRQVAAQAA